MYDLAWKIDQVNGTAEEGHLSHRRFKTRYNDFRIFTIFSTYLPHIFCVLPAGVLDLKSQEATHNLITFNCLHMQTGGFFRTPTRDEAAKLIFLEDFRRF